MKPTKTTSMIVLALTVAGVTLSCGEDTSADETKEMSADAGHDSDSVDSAVSDTDADTTPGPATGADIVGFAAVSNSDDDQDDVPVTFGQIFERGAVGANQTVSVSVDGQAIATQVDKKATWPDGSLRHAIISVNLPTLAANSTVSAMLSTAEPPASRATPVSLDDVLDTDFDAHISVDIAGDTHTIDARPLLEQANQDGCSAWGDQCKQWLSGPQVSEWLVGAPVGDPHLHAAFYVRAYLGSNGSVSRVRVDSVIENAWAYENTNGQKVLPQKLNYDATITTADQSFSVSNLSHYDHARWHKTLWWNGKPSVYPRLDTEYIQQTRAVSNYADLTPSDDLLNGVPAEFDPMSNGDNTAAMGNTGAQPTIGPLPRWTATYIVSSDARAYNWMLANDDAVGSYSFHIRDAATGRPLTITDHPDVTIGGVDFTDGPADPQNDLLPGCPDRDYPTATGCHTPYSFNIAHHPSIGVVPYMVTGDFYHLEEMQFAATYVVVWRNAGYRDHEQGHLGGQVRGQAWSLRSIADAAFLTPDDDPMKDYFIQLVANNLDHYNRRFTNASDADQRLHLLRNAIYPLNGQDHVGIAPWQQDFFTWAVGHTAELGFDAAEPFLTWLAKFQVGRMTNWKFNEHGFCWLQAAVYKLQIRDTEDSPYYSSLDEAYAATEPDIYELPCNSQQMMDAWGDGDRQIGEMSGYPYSETGFPANMQPALAIASDSGIPNAELAWQVYDQERSVRPDYANYPNFAVIPRHLP